MISIVRIPYRTYICFEHMNLLSKAVCENNKDAQNWLASVLVRTLFKFVMLRMATAVCSLYANDSFIPKIFQSVLVQRGAKRMTVNPKEEKEKNCHSIRPPLYWQ